MDNFSPIGSIKEEPEEEPFTYMNLSDNPQPSPSTTSSYGLLYDLQRCKRPKTKRKQKQTLTIYKRVRPSPGFAKPTPQVKTEIDDNEEGGTVINLDSQPKIKEAKKRGRPKKPKEDGVVDETSAKKIAEKKMKQESLTENLNVKKKRDRFNGMPEEEVLLRLLPDILAPNLDILIIGINPGLFAAYVGHHYAGPGNHFWKCLYLSGLIPEPMNAYDDFKLPSLGIGFTNICSRTTRGSSDLRKSEIKEGGEVLKRKVLKYRPKIAVFNGKGIYEVFSAKKEFSIGKQPEIVEGTNTQIFVMPSSSARCAQLPRASDKVPFFLALKKLRDHLKGELPHLDESEIVFPNVDMRQKPDVKCEKIESSECAAELTPDEIIMRTEYLEALEASAEGREIPAERMEKTLKRRIKGGSDDEDCVFAYEDEESSQSSGSSDALRGIYNTDGSNYSAYCYSKNVVGSSSFEIVSSPQVRDDLPGEESGGKRVISPLRAEKDDSNKSSGDLRAAFSPKPLSQSATTMSQNSRSSPLYTNLGGLPPKSSMASSSPSPATPTGKQYQKAAWHPQHTTTTSHINSNYSESSETTTTDLTPRQSSQPAPYSHVVNNNSNQMTLYNNTNYCGGARPPSQPATIPYYPNCGGNSDNQPQNQMSFGPSGAPHNIVNSSAPSGHFKGGRPPLHHQWSNGTGGSMPPPTPPHNGTHPYYGRSNHNVGLSSPHYPANTSPVTSPYKNTAVGMHPALQQQVGMVEKNQKNSGNLNGSYNNVPTYYAT